MLLEDSKIAAINVLALKSVKIMSIRGTAIKQLDVWQLSTLKMIYYNKGQQAQAAGAELKEEGLSY